MMTLTCLALLGQNTVDLKLADASLEEAIDVLRDMTGLNFIVDSAVDRAKKVSLQVRGVRLSTALKLLLKPHGLGAKLQDGVWLIAPESKLSDPLVTRLYDTKDLFHQVPNFEGGDLNFGHDGLM